MMGTEDADLADAIEDALRASGGESNLADDLLKHIHTRVSDEGVVIDIKGLSGAHLFNSGSARPTQRMVMLLDMIASILPLVQNDIAVIAYRQDGVFPASGTDRAEAIAALLTRRNLPPTRIERVTGHATRESADIVAGTRPDDRVTVTILRN